MVIKDAFEDANPGIQVELQLFSNDEKDFVTQFFKILESVGKTELKEKPEKTVYSSCADPENLVYYYKTYENGCISAVDMKKEDLEGEKIISYPMVFENDIFFQN